LLAEAYLKSERYEKGMEQANLAMAISSEIGDRWCLPRIHAIRGRLLQSLGQGDAAETSLKMAVDVAATQSAKGEQLHTPIRLHASGVTRVRCSKLANCLLRFTGGSLRVSTRAI